MPGKALNIKDEAMPQGWGMASSVQLSVFGLSSVASGHEAIGTEDFLDLFQCD